MRITLLLSLILVGIVGHNQGKAFARYVDAGRFEDPPAGAIFWGALGLFLVFIISVNFPWPA